MIATNRRPAIVSLRAQDDERPNPLTRLRSSQPLTVRPRVMYDNCRDLSTRFAITSVSNSSFAVPLMNKNRLEAFSDGVLAIIITIMVLEMKVPQGSNSLADLKPVVPVLVSYVLSFIYVGIYWNNHHHMLHAVGRVSGGVLWANLHLLFWLSLIPFGTAWVGTSHFAAGPTALYGFVLLMASLAYWLLQYALLRARSGLGVGEGRRKGRQRKNLAFPLRGGRPLGLCQSLDFGSAVLAGGVDLAHSGSPHRTGDRRERLTPPRRPSPRGRLTPFVSLGIAKFARSQTVREAAGGCGQGKPTKLFGPQPTVFDSRLQRSATAVGRRANQQNPKPGDRVRKLEHFMVCSDLQPAQIDDRGFQLGSCDAS